MKITNPWKCDYCSAVKGPSNHWYMVNVSTGNAIMGFILVPWHEIAAGAELQGKPQYEHICGSVCAGKALEKWLGNQNAAAVQ